MTTRACSSIVGSAVVTTVVVEIVGTTSDGDPGFRAWEYYDVKTGNYKLTSIDHSGQLTTMEGELGDEFSRTASRKNNAGKLILMKFTHHDITPDSFTARGELSTDEGETWFVFTRQRLTRIGK